MLKLISCLFSISAIFSDAYTAVPTVILLEEPSSISSSSFSRGRVCILKADKKGIDLGAATHGVRVASVLIGPASVGKLPTDVSIYVAEGWRELTSKLKQNHISDKSLLVINWSGLQGAEHSELIEYCTHLLKIILEEITNKSLAESLSFMETLTVSLRAEASGAGATEGEASSSRLSQLFTAMDKITAALKEQKADSFDRAKVIENIKTAINPLIETPKAEAQKMREKALKDITELMRVFPNTLIIWALGNEEECIDEKTEWKDYLDHSGILERTVLVEGVTSAGGRHRESNYTKTFAEHVVRAHYRQNIWENGKVVRGEGTSFSAAAVTAEAYRLAVQKNTTDFKSLKALLLTLSKEKVLGQIS